MLRILLAFSVFGLTETSNVYAQCNSNTSICTEGISGPYGFSTPGDTVSSCLDFFGPGYAYIILYITQSGPLEMLIDGDVTTGFLDVAIFNVPSGQDPCVAINDPANEISCNYASNAGGCNQIGTYFPCTSSVPSPNVNVGDRLMIVVENWSGASTNFTLQLAPAPAAQTGPADPTIDNVSTLVYTNTTPFQLSAADMGGTWSGPGVTSGGIFDPGATGSGTYTVNYSIGSPPCDASDSYEIVVNSALAAEMGEIDFACMNGLVELDWETITEKDCDYFRIERSRDAINFEEVGIVQGSGTTNTPQNYEFFTFEDDAMQYYRIVEVDVSGVETNYGPFYVNCKSQNVQVKPNPTEGEVDLTFSTFHVNETYIEIFDQMGRRIDVIKASPNGEQSISFESLAKGVYTILLRDNNQSETLRIIRI